jgi:hypothetical protein
MYRCDSWPAGWVFGHCHMRDQTPFETLGLE